MCVCLHICLSKTTWTNLTYEMGAQKIYFGRPNSLGCLHMWHFIEDLCIFFVKVTLKGPQVPPNGQMFPLECGTINCQLSGWKFLAGYFGIPLEI